ncbi:hypothetical protein CLV51_1011680 [Chitinophaga niastensis]|uniref:Uncharacterized protein n=1 Tax=Chitinophaga niastensis TaxID=536980 RepID=A0A2P8HVZ3_CHINA|nr:hypothetical protein CLV51_1011680 [Chitinophaga niastensis]
MLKTIFGHIPYLSYVIFDNYYAKTAICILLFNYRDDAWVVSQRDSAP